MVLLLVSLMFAAGSASAAKLVNIQQLLPPGGNPQTVNVTVKHPNSILVVGATVDNSAYPITQITYDGVAPDGVINTDTNRAYLAYWLHPAMGTNALTITLSAALYSTTRAIQAAEVTGIDLSNAVNSTATGTNNTTTITTASNTNGGNVYIVDFTYNNGNNSAGDTVAPASGSILTIPSGASLFLGAGSQESIFGTGSVAGTGGPQQLGWDFSDPSDPYVELAVAFNQPLLIDVSANVSPSSGQVGDSFTVTADVTPGVGSTVTNVTVDLSAIGGSSAAPLMLQGGNVYTNTFTVPSAAMTGTWTLKVNALADSAPLTGSAETSFTVLSTDRTWDGGSSVGNNWSDAANWVGDVAPAMGANNLIFSGTTRLAPDMDGDYGASGLTFDSTAGSYVLGSSGGHVLTLAGDINDNSSSAQTINVSIVNVGNTIHVYGNNDMTIGGGISGAGGLEQDGYANLILKGTNSFGGGLTINSGSLQIAGAGVLGGSNGNYAGVITNAGVLEYSSSATQTLSGVISSYGNVIKDGSGKLILAGNNTYYGDTYISNGVLQVSGTLANDVGNDYLYNITDNGILQFTSAASQTLGGTISGTGSVVMDGAGTLNMNGVNSYSGPTIANGGTLAYNPNTVSYSTPVHSLVINNGGTVLVSASSSSSLPVNNLTMNTNGVLILSYNFSGGNPTAAALAVSGSLSAPGTNVIRISGFGAAVGQFPLISYTGTLAASMSHLVLILPPGLTGSLVNNTGNHTIDLNVTSVSSITTWYTMTGDDGYGASSFNSSGQWSSGSAPANGYGYYTGPHLLRTPADTNNYTFAGSALSVSQYGFDATVGRFLLKGTGDATITVDNLILDGGLVDYADGGPNITRTLAGNVLLNSGTTSYLGALVNEVMFVTAPVSGAGNLQFGGANVNGGTDTGVVTLNGANTYSGSTTVGTGTLLVNGSVPNSSITVLTNAMLGGTGSVGGTVTVQSGGTLTAGNPAYNALTNTIGTLTVSGAVTISGEISMQINRDASPNSDELNASSVTMKPGSTITVNNIGSANLVAGDTFTLFSAPPTGSFTVTNLPVLPAGLAWTNNLAVNGTIGVYTASVGPSGPEQLTNSYDAASGTLKLSWPAGHGWRLQMQTDNLTTGLSTNWTYITDGTISSTNITVNSTNASVFYRLTYP